MASITKRRSKAGHVAYLIRVFMEQGTDGKQTTKSTTWKPPAGMRDSAADKQARKEAVLFEQKIKHGAVCVTSRMRFGDYAVRWMETVVLAPKTREQYVYLLRRIHKAIGHIPLDKLRVEHLQDFYKHLRQDGMKQAGVYTVPSQWERQCQKAGLSRKRLSELSGVSLSTVATAARGSRVSQRSAQRLSAALGCPMGDLFAGEADTQKLSDRTVWHHHKLIRSVLSAAKKSRLLSENVTEFMEAPKLPRAEARYLDDKEAQAFFAALQHVADIRVKTALSLDLFTGLRRGELCGLEWPDIDFDNLLIHIRRASQYIPGLGITTLPTKNRSSDRSITVTPFVMAMLKRYKTWWMENRRLREDIWKGTKERLFIQEDGRPIFPSTINHWLRNFIQRNQLPDISPHALRHTFITLQLVAGIDIRTIQARSGHAQASTLLNVYSHAVHSAQVRAAQAMDDMLLGSHFVRS